MDGFDYVGCGNSTSKKDAQTNAAKDFCQYLVREGKLNAAEVPSIDVSIYSINQDLETGCPKFAIL